MRSIVGKGVEGVLGRKSILDQSIMRAQGVKVRKTSPVWGTQGKHKVRLAKHARLPETSGKTRELQQPVIYNPWSTSDSLRGVTKVCIPKPQPLKF